jgi:hypothetical protein
VAEFEGAGIPVAVGDNTNTTFYATASWPGGTSACSISEANYVEVSPPPPPVPVSSDPPSGANQNAPKIKGTAAGATSVELFTNASCSPAAVATGTQATFQGAGIQVSVADNSTTSFYARSIGPGGTSACSISSVTYSEVTPPAAKPPGPTGRRAAALRKCKKIKNKLKKKKCKKRAQRLPL